MKEVIRVQVQRVDKRERSGRAIHFGNRHRAVERHYRTWRQRQQLVVERENLPPIRSLRGWSIAVHRVDRGLDLVCAWLIAAQTLAHQLSSFGNEPLVPQRAVLISQ